MKNDIKGKIAMKMLYYLMTPETYKGFNDKIDIFLKSGKRDWEKFASELVYKKIDAN